MNIFRNFESFIAFPLLEPPTRLISVAKKIGDELLDQKHLLNKYLSELFKISSTIDLNMVISLTEEICSDVLESCYKVCYNNTGKEENKYFSLVKNYINEHPSDIKHTRVEYYATKILMAHLEFFADDFVKLLNKKFDHSKFDKLNHYYKEISKIVSEDRMEHLNDLLCEVFFMCPIGVAFAGQITANCVNMLTFKDPDKSKQIFEIILDEY